MNKACLFLLLNCSILFADDWNGTQYVRNSSLQKAHAEILLESLGLKADDCVLDVGCGDGRVSERLANKVPQGHVLGIDPSDSMIGYAKTRNAPNLHFLQTSAEDFSLPERFDHAISIHVMHWIKNQKQALENIYTHLKADGQLHIIMSPSKEGLAFDKALKKTLSCWNSSFVGFENPQQVYDVETYRQHLVDAGFHIDSMHYVYNKKAFESKESFKNWIRQWLAYAKHLPEKAQEAFLSDLVDAYLDETNGCINYGEYILIAHATKKMVSISSS